MAEHEAAQSSSMVGSSPHSGHRVALSPRSEYPQFMQAGACADEPPGSIRIGQYHMVHPSQIPQPMTGELMIVVSYNELAAPDAKN